MSKNAPEVGMLSRAQGCLLGQLAGDSLGSLVEFCGPDDIRREYPNGVRELADGGTWNVAPRPEGRAFTARGPSVSGRWTCLSSPSV